MSEPEAVAEEYSSVPFRYRAILELNEDVGSYQTPHSISLNGVVHPEPYDLHTAIILAQRKLTGLTGLGWRVTSLLVTKWGSKDA